MKVMFFPKPAPNSLHGVGGKLACVVQIDNYLNTFLFEYFTDFGCGYCLSFTNRLILHSPILYKLLNAVKNSAF